MRWVDLGPVDLIPLGEGRTFGVGDERIAVFRTRDGRLSATQALCPHKGGTLADGLLGSGKVLCPLHGWAFRFEDGACLSGGAGSIRTYEVSATADGRILLCLSASKDTAAA